jgi:hypothetical protein
MRQAIRWLERRSARERESMSDLATVAALARALKATAQNPRFE